MTTTTLFCQTIWLKWEIGRIVYHNEMILTIWLYIRMVSSRQSVLNLFLNVFFLGKIPGAYCIKL